MLIYKSMTQKCMYTHTHTHTYIQVKKPYTKKKYLEDNVASYY